MTKAMEQNSWYKQKRPAVDEYLATVRQIEDVTAMHGHLYRPGFLGLGVTSVERALKFKLSDINYAITKEAIERELAQTGFDYELVYKNAMVEWELEKTQLLTALERELADGKYLRELDLQELERQEIEINLRKLVIMAAQTAIAEDMEAYRQELTQVDQSTFAAEDALLNAKLLTAQHKLDVIPYIETVLEKQQDIITAETNNADRKQSLITRKEDLNDKRLELITVKELIAEAIVNLIAAKQSLVEKKSSLISAKELVSAQEAVNINYLNQYIETLTGLSDVQQDLIAAKRALIPKINEKSSALIAYTAELDAWILVKQAIAGIKEDIASEMETKASRKGDIIDSRVDLNSLKLDLQEAQINLEIAKITGRSNLLSQKIVNAAILLTERQEALDAKIEREGELLDAQMVYDLYREDQEFESMKEINDYVIPKQKSYVTRTALARINERGKLAEISANAEITSQLVHLLT